MLNLFPLSFSFLETQPFIDLTDNDGFDDLVSDLSRDGQEYLDLTLDQEAEYLKTYLKFVDNDL